MNGFYLFLCCARANCPTFVSGSLLISTRCSAASFPAVNYLTCSPTTKPIIKSNFLLHAKLCEEYILIEAIRAAPCEDSEEQPLRYVRVIFHKTAHESIEHANTRLVPSRMLKRSTTPRNPSALPAQQVPRPFSHEGFGSRKSKGKRTLCIVYVAYRITQQKQPISDVS